MPETTFWWLPLYKWSLLATSWVTLHSEFYLEIQTVLQWKKVLLYGIRIITQQNCSPQPKDTFSQCQSNYGQRYPEEKEKPV